MKKPKKQKIEKVMKWAIGWRIAIGVTLVSLAFIPLKTCTGNTPPCPSGWTEWEGKCAAIPNPEISSVPEVQPSKEKPPRHPEPAWQRGDVIADTPQSLASQDAKQDAERDKADAEGKKAAGVPIR